MPEMEQTATDFRDLSLEDSPLDGFPLVAKLLPPGSELPMEQLSVEEMGEVPDFWKKLSRYRSKTFKPLIAQRADGACEACGFVCRPILHCHHIIPVSDGGWGNPNNLIVLCPNCHEVVNWFMRHGESGDEATDFYIWLCKAYGNAVAEFLMAVAYGEVYLSEGEWRRLPGDTVFV